MGATTIPIISTVTEALGADSVLRQSRDEINALERLARLAEEWIEEKVKGNTLRWIDISGEMETARMEFRRAERKRREAEKKSSGRSS